MVKEYKNFDIVDLAVKQKLIGVELKDKQGNFRKIANYYIDFATQEINIIFEGKEEAEVFNFKQKFTVRIEDYRSINKLRRRFKKLW
jgi:hypothetical protein